MNTYELIPYVGTGELRFGMTYDDVIKILGSDFKIKSEILENIRDIIFHKRGLLLSFYCDKLEYIGFLKNTKPYLGNQNLLELSLIQIKSIFQCNMNNCIEDSYSLIIEDIGLSFYFVNKKEDAFPDEVSIFIKNYYK